MTMLDDDTLATLFARAAEASRSRRPAGTTSWPARSARRALARPPPTRTPPTPATAPAARDEPDHGHDPPRCAGSTATARRHRILSVAACVLLVLVLWARWVRCCAPRPRHPRARPAWPRSRRAVRRRPAGEHHHPAVLGQPRRRLGRVRHGCAAVPGRSPTARRHRARGREGSTNTAPSLPSNAVGRSAEIEQTGSLGPHGGAGHALQDDDRAVQPGRDVRRLRGELADPVRARGRAGRRTARSRCRYRSRTSRPRSKQAQALGKTTSLSTKATDVTGQYVDLQSRIAALQSSRQQYLTIMAKADTVGDVLAVQAQLDTIQTQIEQLQGQLNVLASETSYSSLTVTASEGTPPSRTTAGPVARVGPGAPPGTTASAGSSAIWRV